MAQRKSLKAGASIAVAAALAAATVVLALGHSTSARAGALGPPVIEEPNSKFVAAIPDRPS